MTLRPQRAWLCLPFLVLFAVDVAVTLHGQSPAYWAGDYVDANEGFPIFAAALAAHPLAFIGLCALWGAIFSLIIVAAPARIAEITSLALINGHTWGAMTWLVYDLQLNYTLCILLFFLSATLFITAHVKWRRGEMG